MILWRVDMPSYKIHSIKDSEKLSFIIEGENESSVAQKLSREGHIILSTEKIEIPQEDLFCFEGRKQDGSFIEGKISADDIFIAHDMLTREYKYALSKLYPEAIQDKEKQEKIFQELRDTFQENKRETPKKNTDTSKQSLLKYKKISQSLFLLLQQEMPPNGGTIMSELKKLEQNNNLPQIQQTLKDILRELAKQRKNKHLQEGLKPLMRDMGMLVLPDFYFLFLEKTQQIVTSLSPLFHPRDIPSSMLKHNVSQPVTPEEIRKEYALVHDNEHIHTFLRKKYRSRMFSFQASGNKKHYFYTLFREKHTLFALRKMLKKMVGMLRITLCLAILMACISLLFGQYDAIFVTTQWLGIFLVITVASLVIQSDTV